MPMPRMSRLKTEAGKSGLAAVLEEVSTYFRFLTDIGFRGFDCSAKSLDVLAKWGTPQGSAPETLEQIRYDLGDCRRCGLAGKRKNIVFGAGNAGARIVFVGEAPGYHEDQKGQPFVGAAGQLLTKIIRAMNLTRESVYICNILKCRPPENRNPLPDEIKACSPFLARQTTAINPDVICALGTFAAQTLLNTKLPISRLRGSFHDYKGIKVMPTYHPAYLLHNPDKKRAVWEDMKKVMKELAL